MSFKGWLYKANYDSPELHGITLGLHELEMKGGLIVHATHLEGTRMKEFLIDDLYRGDFLEGVMAVKYPLEMMPLKVVELDRAGRVDQWIKHWWGCQPLIKLDHVGCLTQGQGSESYLWVPPSNGDGDSYVNDHRIKAQEALHVSGGGRGNTQKEWILEWG